ncbi:hypothetical protein BDP27DRAFT_1379779 [Rhodocollybia butyracea]|uniref:Uncharacterized protein n=1 Tax=Rhodocollybia butyracea TaxID=206335 RepID=A0A9P5UE46_9AGAR|nr:hypothetical protein BDP27DRAFT_1379779 [Rhodocollybia butyracea]
MSNLKRKRGDINDSDDEEPSFGRQILPVANLSENFDGEPSDGMEYLFTVRRDARSLPHVTRVENPYQTAEPVLPPPRNLETTHPSLPSAEWRSLFEIRFKNLRKANTAASSSKIRMPDIKDRAAWWDYLAGKPESVWNPPKKPKALKQKKYGRGMRGFDDDSSALNYNPPPADSLQETEPCPPDPSSPLSGDQDNAETESPPVCKPITPTPSIIGQIDQRMALHLLMYFAYWINQHLVDERQPPFPRLAQTHFQWIFTLLTRVEEHVSADDMNMLRNLTRACIALLKVIISERNSGANSVNSAMKEEANDEASCWMIISVVIGTWGQLDLWMDAEDMLKSVVVA